jgi:hypothetical protein
MTHDEQLISAIINHRGYLVMACSGPKKIGECVAHINLTAASSEGKAERLEITADVKFYIFEQTDVNDLIAQNNFVSSLCGAEAPAPVPGFYYRARAD